MLRAYPKIFALGTDYIKDIFKEPVEISEKVDGSMFVFGKIDGELYARSKGAVLYFDNPQKMFQKALDYVLSIEDKIRDNTVYYSEYLNRPKHNVLKYGRTPKNYLVLFGVSDKTGTKFISKYDELKKCADELEIDVVPLLFYGKINSPDKISEFLETESYLGKVKIEGVVVKNYERKFLLGGQPMPLMAGKFVSEKFKEVHRSSWNKEFTSKGKFQLFKESFRTEARWQKAVQHLREAGQLENSPRDIGKLLKEIEKDIIEEEKENIKEFLWKEFGSEVLREAKKGFPEWYKEQLLNNSFKE